MPLDSKNTVTLAFRVSPRVHVRVKQVAAYKGQSVADIVRTLLDEYLDREWELIIREMGRREG